MDKLYGLLKVALATVALAGLGSLQPLEPSVGLIRGRQGTPNYETPILAIMPKTGNQRDHHN